MMLKTTLFNQMLPNATGFLQNYSSAQAGIIFTHRHTIIKANQVFSMITVVVQDIKIG